MDKVYEQCYYMGSEWANDEAMGLKKTVYNDWEDEKDEDEDWD